MAIKQMQELQNLLQELDMAVAEYEERGKIKAAAEQKYSVELSKALLQGRAQGYPATLLRDISRGLDSVSDARLRRDIADTMYDATRERINAIKLQARMIDSQLSRDLDLAGKQ